jgi:adenylate cyclase
MILKIVKYIGVALLVLLTAFCIHLTHHENEISKNHPLKKFLSFTTLLENQLHDVRMRLRPNTHELSSNIVLAAFDDSTIKEIGNWPPDRTLWADLIHKLESYGAKVVSFNIFFSEITTSADENFSKAIANFQSSSQKKVILPYSLSHTNDPGFANIPNIISPSILTAHQSPGVSLAVNYRIGQENFPSETLLTARPGLAFSGIIPDEDGVFRHYNLVSEIEGFYLPSLALMSYQAFTNNKTQLRLNSTSLHILETSQGKLDLNSIGAAKIRWMGPHDRYRVIPIVDILNAGDDDLKMTKNFKDKLVFVGLTSQSAADKKPTPIDQNLPGVFLHLSVVDMLLNGHFHKAPSQSTLYSWILLTIGTLLILFIMIFKSTLIEFIALILIVLGLILADMYFLLPEGYEIKLLLCIFCIASTYLWARFINLFLKTNKK